MVGKYRSFFIRGSNAWRSGVLLHANPYDADAPGDTEESVRYRSWRNGWLYQKYLDVRRGILV